MKIVRVQSKNLTELQYVVGAIHDVYKCEIVKIEILPTKRPELWNFLFHLIEDEMEVLPLPKRASNSKFISLDEWDFTNKKVFLDLKTKDF